MRRSRRGFAALDADLAVVAAYGLILPKPILEAPKAGLHQRPCLAAAALARRGADPARDPRRRRDQRRDASCRWTKGSTPARCCSGASSTFVGKNGGQVTDELAKLGAKALDRVARAARPRPSRSRTPARPMRPRSTRPRRGSTGRSRPSRSSGRSAPSSRSPAPGSRPMASGSSCSRPNIEPELRQAPARCSTTQLTIACGEGAIRPLHVQRAGRAPMSAERAAARLPDSQGHDPVVTRWRLTIEYDGGPFMGWQRQDHGPSVQQALEEAIHRMTGELARVHAAGRTDAGVHALAMAAHVDIDQALTAHRLREGLNALVRPQPISVLDGRAGRRRLARALLLRRAALSLSHPQPPRAAGARRRARVAHRRPARRRRRCSEGAAHARRTPRFHHLPLGPLPVGQPGEDARPARGRRVGEEIHIEAAARSFLHHQVRSMVGCLALVGRGQWQPEDMRKALEARDRAALGFNAPPARPLFRRGGLPLDEHFARRRAAFPVLRAGGEAVGAGAEDGDQVAGLGARKHRLRRRARRWAWRGSR